jgi:hypothetical protein
MFVQVCRAAVAQKIVQHVLQEVVDMGMLLLTYMMIVSLCAMLAIPRVAELPHVIYAMV